MTPKHNQISCPFCGGENIETKEATRICKLPFATEFAVKELIDTCVECAGEGDFRDVNDNVFDHARKLAIQESVKNMLDAITANGISNAELERSLSLPSRTVARWKRGEYSESVVALLRIIATFNWITDVAKQNFDQRYAQARVVMQAGASLLKSATEVMNQAKIQVGNSSSNFAIKASLNIEMLCSDADKVTLEGDEPGSLEVDSGGNLYAIG